VVLVPIGMVAIWGGWVTAETGRQPWIVYGKLLTAAAVSPLHPVEVLTTFVLFIVIYLTLLGTYAWYVARAVRIGPDEEAPAEPSAVRPGIQTPRPGIAPAV
jgi:cytochrome d ubiquinol oxidase subunit I